MRPEVEQRLGGALDRLGPLPVLTGTVAQVRELAEDPYSLTDDVVAVIERDEAFALNLLRFANQAAVRPLRARTIRQAVTLVGRRALARVALEAATYRFLERFPGSGRVSRGQLHVHAVAVAACAVSTAERVGAATEVVHLAGLLHDVGKLILPLAFPPEQVEAIALRGPVGTMRAARERAELGVDHAYAGALLARRSGVADDAQAAIAHHHGGRSGQDSPTPEAACVQVGNAVVNMLAGVDADHELVHIALARLGLPARALDELAEESAVARPQTLRRDSLAAKVGQLERLAQTDELTGLANRRHWLAQAREAVAGDAPVALLICDLDHFKLVNDRNGHRAGDLLLAEVARGLERHGVAGRLGGDEFGLLVPGGLEAGRRAGERIVADAGQPYPAGQPAPVSLSVGVAAAPEHGRDLTPLLEAADRALYQAKAAGRGRAATAPVP